MPPSNSNAKGSTPKQSTLLGFFTKANATPTPSKTFSSPATPQAKAKASSSNQKTPVQSTPFHLSSKVNRSTSSPTLDRSDVEVNSHVSLSTIKPLNLKPNQSVSSANDLTPPPSSGAALMDLDDEDDMPIRRIQRKAAKRKVTYADSDSDGHDCDSGSERDGFSPSQGKKRTSASRKKRLKSRRDEDDFIASDNEAISEDEAPTAFAMDDEEDDDDDQDEHVGSKQKSTPKAPKPSTSRSSSLSAFKMGTSSSVSNSTPSKNRFSPESLVQTSASPSLAHLTKAERRVIEEKRKKQENEQAYSFLVDLRDKDGNRPGEPEYDSRTVYIPKSAWKDFTPFEQQFWKIKQNHWDTVLFFQKGKFYELYEEDALIGHREFNLKLTDRVKMKMVGVPESSFDTFAAKFLALGYKVGRVDQTETAVAKSMRVGEKSRGSGSEIVNRELRHVLTSGTIVDASSLPDDFNSYCIAIKEDTSSSQLGPIFGLCTLDAATAEFNLTEFQDDESRTRLETVLRSLRLKELLHEKGGLSPATQRVLRNTVSSSCQFTMMKPETEFLDYDSTLRKLNTLFNPDFDAETNYREVDPIDPQLLPKGISTMLEKENAISALGGLLSYLTQLNLDRDLCSTRNFNIFDPLRHDKCMVLDAQSLTHLNVLQNEQGTDQGTLLRLLNRCVTPSGKRLFKIWLVAPLATVDDIRARQDAVEDFLSSPNFEEVFDAFGKKFPDIERIVPRIHAGKCRPRDFTTVLKALVTFQESIEELVVQTEPFQSDVIVKLLRSIPPVTLMAEELQSMFHMAEDGSFTPKQSVFERFDEAEDAITEINNKLEDELNTYRKQLKLNASKCGWKHIGTNDIYQVEVPVSTKVPANWVKMSATKDKHRFYSPKVRDLVQELKQARETRLAALKLFHVSLFEKFVEKSDAFINAIKIIAEIDCLLSLAKASYAMGEPTCRPELVDHTSALVEFDELRHPCIGGDQMEFIPNDIKLGGDHDEVVILTGGNMAGKSTTARTTATGVILAQLGCRVPARHARISPVDRIASRMGANDQIFRNNSTFMVEMLEASRIISQCTPRSLVVMDELGRGTSTFDGQAIAFAVLHHLVSRSRCLTFFLTHYTNLAYDFESYPRVSNKHMQVLVDDDKREVVFTYRLIAGIAASSYGTQVAALAGVPHEICDRAAEVSKQFMASSMESMAQREHSTIPLASLSDFVYLIKTAEMDSPQAADKSKAQVVVSQLSVIQAQIKNLAAQVHTKTFPSAVIPPSLSGADFDVAANRKVDTSIIRPSTLQMTYGGRNRRTRMEEPASMPSTPTKQKWNGRIQGETGLIDQDSLDTKVDFKPLSSPISSDRPILFPKVHSRSKPTRRTPKTVGASTAASKEAEQLILDLGQKIRIKCKDCQMQYDSSSPEDYTLHRKYHERMIKGIDWTAKALMLEGERVTSFCPKNNDRSKPLSMNHSVDLATDKQEVDILYYSMESVKESTTVRKVTELLASVDDALGAAPLLQSTIKTAKVYVAVRAGRAIGAVVVGKVPSGSARYVVPASPVYAENKENRNLKTSDKLKAFAVLNDGGEAIFVSDRLSNSKTPPIGVYRIHVIPTYRRLGVAAKLLDAAAENTVYGLKLPSLERMYGGRGGTMAFSQPTEAGRKLAENWIRTGVSDNRAQLIVFEG